MLRNTLSNHIFDMIQKEFAFPLKDRLHIAAEVDMYRKGEDESIWRQDKNEDYSYQVYFDGEFVCFFDVKENKTVVYIKIMKGLKDLYQQGKIHWNKSLYEFDKPKVKEEIKMPKADNPVDKIIQEAIKRKDKKFK